MQLARLRSRGPLAAAAAAAMTVGLTVLGGQVDSHAATPVAIAPTPVVVLVPVRLSPQQVAPDQPPPAVATGSGAATSADPNTPEDPAAPDNPESPDSPNSPDAPTDPDETNAVAGTCYNTNGATNHAYSNGFTTCGTADGISAGWTPSGSTYTIESGDGSAHINATVWLDLFTSAGYGYGTELGYWRGNQSALSGCYYNQITQANLSFTQHCLYRVGNAPPATTFRIQSRAKGSSTFDFYTNGTRRGSYTVAGTTFHRLDAGWEEQAAVLSSGVSANVGPSAAFTSLQFRSASNTTWYSWGKYSHCLVSPNKGEGFAPKTFATSFQASIGPSAGTGYLQCNGSNPSAGRTTW